MPCGMITPVAQLGKSWSNAWNAFCVHTRPSRKSCPRCSFALVSMENTGLPAVRYLAFSLPIRRNWVSRSGLCPPARTFSILCRPNFCDSIQSCTTGGLTGVPMYVAASAICRGERSVHSTSFSSGSPAIRTSSIAFRFCSSSGSDSIFFSDRHRDAVSVLQQGRSAIGQVRRLRVRWSALNIPVLRRCTRSHHVPTAPLRETRIAVDPAPTMSAKTPASVPRCAVRTAVEIQMPSLAFTPSKESS
jgi:hypothetical protein